jgi:hypothetical protein
LNKNGTLIWNAIQRIVLKETVSRCDVTVAVRHCPPRCLKMPSFALIDAIDHLVCTKIAIEGHAIKAIIADY